MLGLFRRINTTAASSMVSPPSPHRQRFGIEIGYYHAGSKVVDCLSAFRPGEGRLVAVIGVRSGIELPGDAAVIPDRLILTSDTAETLPSVTPGCLDTDPYRAVTMAISGLQDTDTLLILVPADWEGPAPELLIDTARRWHASPHSSEDDVYFGANTPN